MNLSHTVAPLGEPHQGRCPLDLPLKPTRRKIKQVREQDLVLRRAFTVLMTNGFGVPGRGRGEEGGQSHPAQLGLPQDA